MTDRRILFHKRLCEILSCPIEGEQCRCYFQPPESIKMNYPAIVSVSYTHLTLPTIA